MQLFLCMTKKQVFIFQLFKSLNAAKISPRDLTCELSTGNKKKERKNQHKQAAPCCDGFKTTIACKKQKKEVSQFPFIKSKIIHNL